MSMPETFKPQAITRLKTLGKDTLALVANAAFDFVELAIKESPNKYDDMLLVATPKLKEVVLNYIDELFTEEDN